jgi:hypothetical protein
MDKNSLFKYVNKSFNSYLLPNLMNFVRIPNTSTEFDPDWKQNGLLLKACNSVINYAKSLNIKGAEITLLQDEGYTPFILIDIPSTRQKDTRSILLYGHVDKQPEGVGWDKDKSATKPVIENGRLYGRGTADDGYAYDAESTREGLDVTTSHFGGVESSGTYSDPAIQYVRITRTTTYCTAVIQQYLLKR